MQCCVSSCCVAKGISYMFTYIPSFLDFLSIEVTREHRARFPGLYSRFSLVTYFNHTWYICQSQSPNLSHPSSPTWYPYICREHLCLYSCFADRFICIIFLDSTYTLYYMILVFLFLTYIILYDNLWVHPHLCKCTVLFLFRTEKYSIVYMYHIFFIHLLLDINHSKIFF